MAKGRTKGNAYERKIGKLLRDWAAPILTHYEQDPKNWFIRTPLSGGWNRKHTPGEDLVVPKWFPFAIECKKRESLNHLAILSPSEKSAPWSWLFATEEKTDRPVILIFSRNRTPDFVLWRITQLEDYLPTNEIPIVIKAFDDQFGLTTIDNFLALLRQSTFLS